MFAGNVVPLDDKAMMVDGDNDTCVSGNSLNDPYPILKFRLPIFSNSFDKIFTLGVLGDQGITCDNAIDDQDLGSALFVYRVRHTKITSHPRLPFYGKR